MLRRHNGCNNTLIWFCWIENIGLIFGWVNLVSWDVYEIEPPNRNTIIKILLNNENEAPTDAKTHEAPADAKNTRHTRRQRTGGVNQGRISPAGYRAIPRWAPGRWAPHLRADDQNQIAIRVTLLII